MTEGGIGSKLSHNGKKETGGEEGQEGEEGVIGRDAVIR